MTSAQRLQALRGIEDRIKPGKESTQKNRDEALHLVNILITEELKDQRDADVSKLRKDGAN